MIMIVIVIGDLNTWLKWNDAEFYVRWNRLVPERDENEFLSKIYEEYYLTQKVNNLDLTTLNEGWEVKSLGNTFWAEIGTRIIDYVIVSHDLLKLVITFGIECYPDIDHLSFTSELHLQDQHLFGCWSLQR